jgi:uncharacterized protein (TIGR02271 family)
MITRDQVRTVIDHTVCDSEGNKIGKAKHVFLDDVTGEPEWVSVKTGLFGSSETFVPIRQAAMVDDRLQVPYSKDTVKDAPNVDVDSGGHLSEAEEHRLYEHYGIDWDEAWQRANQPGRGGWAASGGDGEASAAGAGVGMGAAGTAAGQGPDADATYATTYVPTDATTDADALPGRGADSGVAEGVAGDATDNAMTRSEERMHVGTERVESGRARLRKYVVTEDEEHVIPVRHEEARITREPITEANIDAALDGPEISEAQHEVTLHEERPVTRMETVPVERVRLETEEVTEQRTVHGRVRKEQIEAETDLDSDR